MADDNRPLKYMRYAIGEIILVVIGILIALSINNWNEDRKTEIRINYLLKNVQKELESNINESKKLMHFYQQVDSIYYLRTNDSVSIEDVYKKPFFVHLQRSYNDMTIVDKAYNNLMAVDDGFSERHESLIEDLNTIYGKNKIFVDDAGNGLEELCYKHDDYLVENTTWYSDYAREHLNDEIINYFLSDPYQANDLERYSTYALEEYARAVTQFCTNSIKAYRAIRKILSEERGIEPDSLYNASGYEKYVGKYRMGDITLDVFIEDDKLFVSNNDIAERKLELHSILDYCFIASGQFIYFNFNKEKGEYDFLISYLGTQDRFSKVK